MKRSTSESSRKPDRKDVERNRRKVMKDLCFKLSSLVPPPYLKASQDMLSQQDQLDQAASYIKELKERVDNLKRTKALASQSLGIETSTRKREQTAGSKLPVVELRDSGSSIEVVLISMVNMDCMLFEVISILEEEGAEVVSASFSSTGDKVFHTIHAQVRILRVGVETTRVYERLKDLIY